MSREPCGVAIIASNVFFHLKPASTGHDDSCVAVCIACAASSPGARKTRYGTPPKRGHVGTRLPRPTPIAVRNSTGATNVPKNALPRQMRR